MEQSPADPNPDTFPSPPYSADVLSDLHAGVMDDDTAGRLWPLVRADRDAQQYLESLDAVTDILGRVGRNVDAGEPVPGWVRHRLESSMYGETSLAATQLSSINVKAESRWTARRGVMVLLAAAAVVGIAAAGLSGLVNGGVIGGSKDHVAVTADGNTSGAIDTRLITESIGMPASGALEDPARLAACLTANGISGDARVLGMSDITLRGRAATLIVVPAPEPPGLTAIAVGDRCGDGSADTISRVELG